MKNNRLDLSGKEESTSNDRGLGQKGGAMNIGSIFSKPCTESESRLRVEKNEIVDFQRKLKNAGYTNVKKDEYVQTVQKPVSTCKVYRCPNIVFSLVNQLPVETLNYKIVQADECYMKDYVITDKKSGQKLYLDKNELVMQKDESSGIKYLTRNRQEGKGAEIRAAMEILDNKAMYDEAYIKLQSNDLQGIEDEEFWDKFFDEMESGDSQEEESGTDSNIIVKPDGSKVLVVTMKIGGMESTMSIKISDPTDFVSNGDNEQSQSQSKSINDNVESTKSLYDYIERI